MSITTPKKLSLADVSNVKAEGTATVQTRKQPKDDNVSNEKEELIEEVVSHKLWADEVDDPAESLVTTGSDDDRTADVFAKNRENSLPRLNSKKVNDANFSANKMRDQEKKVVSKRPANKNQAYDEAPQQYDQRQSSYNDDDDERPRRTGRRSRSNTPEKKRNYNNRPDDRRTYQYDYSQREDDREQYDGGRSLPGRGRYQNERQRPQKEERAKTPKKERPGLKVTYEPKKVNVPKNQVVPAQGAKNATILRYLYSDDGIDTVRQLSGMDHKRFLSVIHSETDTSTLDFYLLVFSIVQLCPNANIDHQLMAIARVLCN